MRITIEGPLKEGAADDLVVDGALLENLVRRSMQAIEKGMGATVRVTIILEPAD